jgi:hypothetical protein
MEVKPMNRKEIHFVIERDGSITSTVKGIKGSLCRTVAAEFSTLGQVTEQNPTNEYYECGSRQRILLDLKQKDCEPP